MLKLEVTIQHIWKDFEVQKFFKDHKEPVLTGLTMSCLEKCSSSEKLSPGLWMAVSSLYSRFNRKTLYTGLLKFTVVNGKNFRVTVTESRRPGQGQQWWLIGSEGERRKPVSSSQKIKL